MLKEAVRDATADSRREWQDVLTTLRREMQDGNQRLRDDMHERFEEVTALQRSTNGRVTKLEEERIRADEREKVRLQIDQRAGERYDRNIKILLGLVPLAVILAPFVTRLVGHVFAAGL